MLVARPAGEAPIAGTLPDSLTACASRSYLFDGAEELDSSGPWEVLAAWATVWPDDGVEVLHAVGGRRAGHAAPRACGSCPTTRGPTAPPLDVLVYPGGPAHRGAARGRGPSSTGCAAQRGVGDADDERLHRRAGVAEAGPAARPSGHDPLGPPRPARRARPDHRGAPRRPLRRQRRDRDRGRASRPASTWRCTSWPGCTRSSGRARSGATSSTTPSRRSRMVDSVISPGVRRHLRASDAARPRPAARGGSRAREAVRRLAAAGRLRHGRTTEGAPSPRYVRPYRPRRAATAFRDHRSTESTI